MVSKLCWLSLILTIQNNSISPMFHSNRILSLRLTNTIFITHLRNRLHRLKYKTPEGIIITEHEDGSETHTYPSGKIIHKYSNPKKSDNNNNQKETLFDHDNKK